MRRFAFAILPAAILAAIAFSWPATPQPSRSTPPGVTRSGAVVADDCVKWVDSRRIASAGAACGGSGGTAANPTATIGTAAVNGVATTYMRSDAAPALGTTTGTGSIVRATSPALTTPDIGTPSAGVGTNLTGLNATQLTTGAVPAARMPALTGDITTSAGAIATTLATVNSNVGSFTNANITVNAKGLITAAANGSAGGSVSISSTSPQLVLTPNPMLTTATIDLTVARNAQTGTTYTLLAGDAGKVVSLSNAASIAVTVPQATGSFAAGYGTEFQSIGAGLPTLTTSTSVFDNGLGTLVMAKGQSAYIWSDSTNWHSVLSLPVVATSTLLGNSSGASNYPTAQTMGTGVIAALGNALSAAGGVTTTVASGTSAMGTSAISSGACATVVTTSATNTATTDTVLASFNGDPTAVTGYVPLSTGMLTIISYPSANNVNFKVCNNTASSITPGAITLNWRILR